MEMVKKVLVSLIDDFDGKPADETVQFGLDGVSYEIDLSAKNATKLREHLQPWVNAGRRTGGSRRRRGVGTGGASIDRKQSADIRHWARKSGYEVGQSGEDPGRGGRRFSGRPLAPSSPHQYRLGIAESFEPL